MEHKYTDKEREPFWDSLSLNRKESILFDARIEDYHIRRIIDETESTFEDLISYNELFDIDMVEVCKVMDEKISLGDKAFGVMNNNQTGGKKKEYD